METIHISEPIKAMVDTFEGDTFEGKLLTLLRVDLENRLRVCTERIYAFEKTYGMTFEAFQEAWETGGLADQYAYDIERDFMEWESLAAEHAQLLSQLRTMRATACHSPS
jgi:hypothetical protein